MPASPAALSSTPRALIFLIAGLAMLAAFLVVTKVVMAPAGKSTPATTVPAAHGVVRTVAGAATAAGKKLDAATGGNPVQTATTTAAAKPVTSTTTTAAGSPGGPPPNTARNPFVG
jgi:hypothetical protein